MILAAIYVAAELGRPDRGVPDPEAADLGLMPRAPPRFARRPAGSRPDPARVRLLVALLGPLVAPHDPAQPIGLPGRPPCAARRSGPTGSGATCSAACSTAASTVIGLGLAAAAVSYPGGLTIGLAAGYTRNLLDACLMRGVDVLLAFPPLLFVLVLVTGAGTSAGMLVLAVGLVQMTGISRSCARPRSRSPSAARRGGRGAWRAHAGDPAS